MRVISKFEGDKLARKVASQVKNKQAITIVADEHPSDVKEEAKTSAITYWMMGWNWDEIETILEDSEYTSAVVSYAMEQAREYAREILNKGPFSKLNAGQGIKLTNGDIGIISDIYNDHISVMVDEQEGKIKVKQAHIDMEATEKFTQAYNLRKQANDTMKKLPVVIAEADEECKEPNVFNTSSNRIEILKKEIEEFLSNAETLSKAWMEKKGNKEFSPEEKRFYQFVGAVSTNEKDLFSKLGTMLSTLSDTLGTAEKAKYSLSSEASEFINSDLSKVMDKLEGHMYNLSKANESINVFTQQFNAHTDTNDFSSAMDFAKKLWEDSQAFSKEFEATIIPTVSAGLSSVGKNLEAVAKQNTSNLVHKVLRIELN